MKNYIKSDAEKSITNFKFIKTEKSEVNVKMKTKKPYYLGLDIGTDSVGYAVTDEKYKLCRFKGESMWGSGLFDPANTCADRRANRTARRRLDRRQMRVRLVQEFFAAAIAEVDPRFFVRLRESALMAKDRTDPQDCQTLFNDENFKDVDYHAKYPTIHHLIVELMENPAPHDPRLVYIACAWLMAHRGHFLQEIDLDNVDSLDDVSTLYEDLMQFMAESDAEGDFQPMWHCADVTKFGEILTSHQGLTAKREAMWNLLFKGVKPKTSPDYRYDRYSVLSLLCGWDKAKASVLFNDEERYAEMTDGICLGMDEEKLEEILSQLDGEDAELVRKLKALYDWAILRDVRQGYKMISEAKKAVFDQHKKDLAWLKGFLRKTDRKLYRKVFVAAGAENYTAYVYNPKKADRKDAKRATKIKFSEWLRKEMAKVTPTEEDRAPYEDMMERLGRCAFLPRQVDGDNRVIPHQLYQVELRRILKNAAAYLPFLNAADEDGTVAEKIESVFAFRIPYFVGPLVTPGGERGKFAWLKRKAEGVIRPWNFAKMVDLDASEDAFIGKLIGHCTYYRGEDDAVLPMDSLLYREFMVLNEINPLCINGARITPDAKRRIVEACFKAHRKVSVASLRKFLIAERLMQPGDELTGIDETIKSNLGSFSDFKGFLERKVLTCDEVEQIILRSACTEDASRFRNWLKQNFGEKLDANGIKEIARHKYAEFGRLSRKFLDGIVFQCKETGEKGTVMDFLRERNVLLMELLSDRYTLSDQLREIAEAYYGETRMPLEERLNEMYVSSAVKRQIYRALDIVKTVVKVMGRPPRKIFVEMARGGTPDQKGKRTKSRYDQLHDLYARIRDEDVKHVNDELQKMGTTVHNRLQGDALYLWCLQLGHCAYCGRPLPVENLKSQANIDHILPQAKVKDDSVMNNKVLCCSGCNGRKKDIYPVPDEMRQESLWRKLQRNGLMTDEKFRRLMRREQLTDADFQGFINRQLVETRQTTKAVFTVLQELYGETELVAVKAGNVSDFRHEFDMLKCRAVNDLHHAKDAYLNIVVGNVYHERFSKRFFNLRDGYSLKITTLFGDHSHIANGNGVAWNGLESIQRVKATMARNDIHLTKYAFYRKGGFFDQMPKGPGESTIPRKKGLRVADYGGYAKPSAVGYLLAAYSVGKKRDIMLVPISLLDREAVLGPDEEQAVRTVSRAVSDIEGKTAAVTEFPLGRTLLKVNTVLTLDGFPYVIRGKSGGGKMYLLGSMRSLKLTPDEERYVKRLDSLNEKLVANRNLVLDAAYDGVSEDQNLKLYDGLTAILASEAFRKMPASQAGVVQSGRDGFAALPLREQIATLLSMVSLVKTNRAGGCDLSRIGGVAKAGVLSISSKISNWKTNYQDVRIVHADFSGLFRTVSPNLTDLV